MPAHRFTAAFALLAALVSLSCRTAVPVELEVEREREREGMENPEDRVRWFWERRAYPAGTIPVAAHRDALVAESVPALRLSDGESWTGLGPAPLPQLVYSLASSQDVSGRTSTLAIHPGDAKTMLVGTAEGGIWKTTDGGASWRSVGEQALPTLVISVIRFSPSDPSLVFAGTGEAAGAGPLRGFGLARSRDGGETWELLPAQGSGWDFNFTAITGLHFDARDGKTLYLTTATVAPRTLYWTLPAKLPQTGIFKSTDDGMSWQLLRAAKHHVVNASQSNGFTDFEYGGAVSPDLMYVSEYHGGILRSTDGGGTWRYVTPLKPTGYGTFPATPSPLSYPVNNRFLLANRVPNSLGETDFRIIELAAAPSDPRVLYAGFDAPQIRLDVDGNGIYETNRDRLLYTSLLFKSTDAGETWRWLGTRHDGVPDYCNFQCWYDNVISVHPANPDDVVLGGAANYSTYTGEPFANPTRLLELPWRGVLYQSKDGGESWADITPHCTRISDAPARTLGGLPVYPCVAVSNAKIVHPDIHDVVHGADGRLYVTGDGGVFRGSLPGPGSGHKRRAVAPRRLPESLAGGSYTWETLNNGLATLQFYRIAVHPDDPGILLGGLQDNSGAYRNGGAWHGWGAADGTVAFFHPLDPKIVYLGTQFEVHRHDDGGTKEFTEAAGWKLSVFAGEEFADLANGETTSFIPVFALDPTNPSITYGASDRALYRSTERGARSVRIGPPERSSGIPTTISVSPVDPRVVWMGTSTSAVYRYDVAPAGTATATRLNAGLPNRFVSQIVAGYDSADTVYAVFNGYNANTPGTPGKVFVSRNRGLTWQNISGDLPDVPANALALHPTDANRLWLATDSAVYATRDGGATWQSERRNMPVVTVTDLVYHAKSGELVAATYGRGIWRMRVGG